MKVRFNRWYNAVLTALLSMLGYGCSALEDPLDMYGAPVEYGCPHADYVVKGTVTDEAGNPIQGIKVTVPNGSTSAHHSEPYQSTLSNADGSFKLDEFSSMSGDFMYIEDIDGEENGGEFMNDTINVNQLPMTQVEKGSGWYTGKYHVTANIKLKKKE